MECTTARRGPGHQTRQGDGLPLPGGAQPFAHRCRACARHTPVGVLQPGSYHRLRRARIGSHRGEARHDGLLLLGALLPVPEAPGRLPGGRLHQAAPLAIGLDHQHRADGRERDRLSQLCIAGGHLLPRLRGTGFESLEAERPPQDGLQRGPTLAGCRVGRPLDGSLAEQVGIAADWHAEFRIEWTVACRPARGAVMAPQAHRPTDRIVGGRALVMRGQRRAVGAGHRPRRAPRRARDNKPAQQRRTPRQQPPEQGQLHGIGGLHPGLGARYLGDQGWEIVLQVLYKLV
jgi:hypothetical protein